VSEDFTPPPREQNRREGGFWYGLELVIHDRSLVSLFLCNLISRLAVRTTTPILPLFVQSLVAAGARVRPSPA